jgi:hypothetical protein
LCKIVKLLEGYFCTCLPHRAWGLRLPKGGNPYFMLRQGPLRYKEIGIVPKVVGEPVNQSSWIYRFEATASCCILCKENLLFNNKAGIRLFSESLLTDKSTKIRQNRTLMAIICPLFHLRLGPRHLEDL